jgi:hypothetical protein
MKQSCLYLFLIFLFASCGIGNSGGNRLLPVKLGRYYGFIDRTGKQAVPFIYSRAGCFAGGLALVADSAATQKWGYIDNSGKQVIQPKYRNATSYSEGMAFVVPYDGVPQAIDKNGIVKFSLPAAQSVENFSEGLAAYSILGAEGEIWGFVDKDGKTKIPPQYRSVSYFSDGLCAVMNRNGEWGYIDKDAEMAIDFQFENAYPFKNDRAKVATRGKWGAINKQGKFILQPRYEDLDIDEKKYLVKNDHKWGWIPGNIGISIPVSFSDAYPFKKNKFAPAKSGEKWGFINESGKFMIAPQYDFAFGFENGLAVVEVGGKYGFIDDGGRYIINPTYDHIPVDYFIRYFAAATTFYSVKTDINKPQSIAYKWLTGFYSMDYDEAKRYATDDTKALLKEFSSISDMISDSTRQQMAGVIIGIRGCQENGDRAIVTYTLSDNKGKEQMLFLVKAEDKWRVQFSKNDAPQAEAEENGQEG